MIIKPLVYPSGSTYTPNGVLHDDSGLNDFEFYAVKANAVLTRRDYFIDTENSEDDETNIMDR